MTGWKLKLGTILCAIGGILAQIPEFFDGQHAFGAGLISIGGPLAAYGLGHKIEKAGGG